MTLIDRFGAGLPRAPVTVDLDDVQATVLRYRPEPYYGTHVMLHVADAQAGRDFVGRLTPHVDSAADWWHAGQLLDYGENDPDHWDAPFGTGLIHIGVSVFSDSEQTWRRTMEMARQQY